MVVDDTPEIRVLVNTILKAGGYEPILNWIHTALSPTFSSAAAEGASNSSETGPFGRKS